MHLFVLVSTWKVCECAAVCIVKFSLLIFFSFKTYSKKITPNRCNYYVLLYIYIIILYIYIYYSIYIYCRTIHFSRSLRDQSNRSHRHMSVCHLFKSRNPKFDEWSQLSPCSPVKWPNGHIVNPPYFQMHMTGCTGCQHRLHMLASQWSRGTSKSMIWKPGCIGRGGCQALKGTFEEAWTWVW